MQLETKSQTQKGFEHKISLGQNFLQNPEVLCRSIEAAGLRSDDVILEIGGGQGALTERLLKGPVRFVHTAEIDNRLSPWLTPLEEKYPERFRVSWGDAMQLDFSRLSPLPRKVVANIPYNITTDLIWKVLSELAPLGLEKMILLVQKESADRLAAPNHSRDRYPLGVTIEQMGRIQQLMKVSPNSFFPPPKVWSSLIEISVEKNRNLAADSFWRKLLADAFRQRRKKMINNLSASFGREAIQDLFTVLDISATARAEELTEGQWNALYLSLKKR